MDPMQALAASLDDQMAQAEIAANSQRDQELEEAGNPPAQPQRQEAQPSGDDGAEDEEEDEGDESEESATAAAASPAAPAAPEAASAAAPTTTTPAADEQPKYSRRDAARFAQERDTAQREAAEMRRIADTAAAELNTARAADREILTALAEVSGYTLESNGRFRYDNLKDKALQGTATEAERTEVAEMTQWAKLAGPIYRQAEIQVTKAFSVDWNALKDLEGVGDAGLQKLATAPNGVAGAREMHALAYQAGAAKARAEAQSEIARLKAQLKSTKISSVARAPQPAVANGAAVPAGGGFRDRAFNADGTINEDFDREVRAGKWLNVDLSSS